MRVNLWLTASVLLMVCLLSTPIVHADYNFITAAEVLVADDSTPPVGRDGWRAITLPRSWARDEQHSSDTRTAWYRIPLPINAAEHGWDHLLMLRHMMNVELWLDTQFIGSGGPVSAPVGARLQRNWNRPVLWTIPPSAFATSTQQYLYVRLISEPDFGVMSPVILGTEESLLPWYRINYFVQITVVKISLMALFFIGFLSLFVWIKTRQRSWFLSTMMSVCWSIPLLYIVLPFAPFGEFIFLRLTHWGVTAGACCLLAFIHSYYLDTPAHKQRLFVAIAVVEAALLTLAPDSQVVNIGNGGQLVCQFLFVILIVQLLRSPLRKSGAVISLVVGLVIMLLAALHDVTLVASSTGNRWRWDTPLSYITQPIILLILAWNGVAVFVNGVSKLAHANQLLQRRLDASETRIRQIFSEQETIEREIRIEAERELVYRDLHDDLGARLLSLVYQSERGAAQDLARTALQDLRDIVSRVLSDEQCMSAVLADCMTEQLNRATALNKTLDWEIDSALDDIQCPSSMTLALRLLLRELVGGCLRLEEVDSVELDLTSDAKTSALVISIKLDADIKMPLLPVLNKRLLALHANLKHEGNQLIVNIPSP